MNEQTIRLPAEWTPDCQGKWDFDGRLVTLSTRYWPRGGGMTVIANGEFQTNADRTIQPSAHSSVYLGSTANEFYDSAVLLIEAEFEGDSEAEVKAQVERWAAEQFARIERALREEFPHVG